MMTFAVKGKISALTCVCIIPLFFSHSNSFITLQDNRAMLLRIQAFAQTHGQRAQSLRMENYNLPHPSSWQASVYAQIFLHQSITFSSFWEGFWVLKFTVSFYQLARDPFVSSFSYQSLVFPRRPFNDPHRGGMNLLLSIKRRCVGKNVSTALSQCWITAI